MIKSMTYLVWTENSPGVLLRLTTLFTKRKINVESLTVSTTEEPGISRFTVVVEVDTVIAETIARQIARIVEVQKVFVVEEDEVVHREVALFRVDFGEEQDAVVLNNHRKAKVLNRNKGGTLIEMCATEKEIDAFLEELNKYQVKEFVRSGRIAISENGEYQTEENTGKDLNKSGS